MKLLKLAGATSEIWQVWIADSSSTTGAGLTGLAFNTASLVAYYHRDVDTTATAISLVTMTVGTFTSSGFKEIDSTNMPGWYQFCPPNAAIASGAKSCAFHLKGATNMAPLPLEVQLAAVNPDSATAFITSVATVTTVTNQLTAAAIATGIWQDSTSGDFTTASSIGKSLYTSGVVPGGTNGLFIAGTNAATTITTSLTTTFTGNLTGSVGSVTARVTANTDQLAGQTVTAAAGVTFPTSVASPTNITAGTITTVTNLTNAATAGDFTSTMKTSIGTAVAASAVASVTGSVGSVVGLTASNLDTTVSSRMATYTQPTGFLAATFPSGTVANTTNITAGTITTATNLTNAPTSGDFTSAMKTSLNAATPNVTVSDKTGFSLSSAAYNAGADAFWVRDMSAISRPGGTTRYPLQVIDMSRNKNTTDTSPAIFYQQDDVTESFRLTFATDVTAVDVVGQTPV